MIEEIDKQISIQLNLLSNWVKEMKFQPAFEFTTQLKDSDIDWSKLRHSGVYLIEVHVDDSMKLFEQWVEQFSYTWEHKVYEEYNTPRLIKKRIAEHVKQNSKGWVPLYIGKSKDISSRVKGHLFMPLEKQTYALKLMSRENLESYQLRLSVVPVVVKNYDAIMPKVEGLLRDRLNPLVGRQ